MPESVVQYTRIFTYLLTVMSESVLPYSSHLMSESVLQYTSIFTYVLTVNF